MSYFLRFRNVVFTVYISLILGLIASRLVAQTITTVAGNGTSRLGAEGDGGPATNASLSFPVGVAVDPQGNLFVIDPDNQRIRKVALNGIISTAVGTGSQGFSGDSGPATSASLNNPYGIAIDPQGNLFIADQFNQRIRRVAPNGIITTVAGNGTAGFAGDGGLATSARLNGPVDVAVDTHGNLFIADYFNQRIRKVAPNGIITTIAGNGTVGFGGDGGPATSASLNGPFSLAVDSQGNIFFVDFINNRIRKVAPNGTISTVAGNGSQGFSGDGGPAIKARLGHPGGVAVDPQDNLLIADQQNNRIRKVTTDGTISTIAGNGSSGFSGDGGAPTSARLRFPQDIVVGSQGNIFIADRDNYRIRKVTVTMPPTALALVSFSLINADTRQEIKLLTADEQLNLANLPTRNLNIRANTSLTTVGSVKMVLSGQQNLTQIKSSPPYALFGDRNGNGNYKNWTPAPGNYSLTATPYTDAAGAGMAGSSLSLNFSVIDQPNAGQHIVSFSLINADTGQEIKLLTADEQLNLASLPTRNLTIRANTNPATVGSVVLVLSGQQKRNQTELFPPYTLFGNTNGNYRNWTPTVGGYRLTATPYSDAAGTGTTGTPLSISFSVIDQPSAARLAVETNPEPAGLRVQYFPNPFWDSFTLQVQGQEPTRLPVLIYDLHGRVVFQRTNAQTEQSIGLGSELRAGVYILQVGAGPKAKRYKLIKAQ